MSAVKANKKSAFSCDQCRKRKVKCGGEQPRCARCVTRVEMLENRVIELEATLANTDAHAPIYAHAGRDFPSTTSTTWVPSRLPAKRTHSGAIKGLKVDERGAVTYHGATSFFHLPITGVDETPSVRNERDSAVEDDDDGDRRKEKLVSNAWQQRAMEIFLDTPEPFHSMLKVHWCWIQPLFNFVNRPAFTRDMEVLGPYYSHTLLNAILSHSVRWCKKDKRIRHLLEPYEHGSLFARQAMSMVFSEISTGHPKVPTVQTLLLLSAQECSAGHRTQAWLYSGMAFRLIDGMGITFTADGGQSGLNLEDEDVEIRQLLFWSCYFWDKMVSLYLGRTPTLQHSGLSPDQIMLDDSAEHDLWSPHGVMYPEGSEYPPTKAHSVTCFRWMCRLWWQDLPKYLRIDTENLPPHCPPSHIVTLNCLYHVFKILLYRPMLFQRNTTDDTRSRAHPHHLVQCISSATSIITIYDLFCRSFGYVYTVLSISYSLYTAASIFLLQIQAASRQDIHTQALTRLQYCIGALDRLSALNLVIGSALGLVTDTLSRMGIEIPVCSTNTIVEPATTAVRTAMQANLLSTTIDPLNYGQSDLNYPELDHHNFNLEDFGISDETLDAFQYLTPIDATFGNVVDQDS
ncbi:fungal-specific transcription factor domain-containing protein [Aspergillus crustosus]